MLGFWIRIRNEMKFIAAFLLTYRISGVLGSCLLSGVRKLFFEGILEAEADRHLEFSRRFSSSLGRSKRISECELTAEGLL